MSNDASQPSEPRVDNEVDPERIDDDTSAPEVDGTGAGNPIAGVQIDEADMEDAVEPDDKAVDGPPAGHA